MRLNVCVFETSEILGQGFYRILSTFPEIGHIEILHDIDEYKTFINQIQPDILLCNADSSRVDILEVLTHRNWTWPDLPIIGYGEHHPGEMIRPLVRKGLSGFFIKESTSPDQLIEIIKVVYDRGIYLSEIINPKLVAELTERNLNHSDENFSPREVTVIRLLCEGKSRDEIAEQLFITSHTVKYHIQKLLDKTSSRNVLELVVKSFKHNWFDMHLYHRR